MEKKRIKTKIGVGYVVKAKDGDMGEKIREGGTRRMRKGVAICVQDVAGKDEFLVKLKYRQKKQMSYCLLVFLCSKEEVEM